MKKNYLLYLVFFVSINVTANTFDECKAYSKNLNLNLKQNSFDGLDLVNVYCEDNPVTQTRIYKLDKSTQQLLDVNPEKKERLKKMMNLLMKELMQAYYCANTDLKNIKIHVIDGLC